MHVPYSIWKFSTKTPVRFNSTEQNSANSVISSPKWEERTCWSRITNISTCIYMYVKLTLSHRHGVKMTYMYDRWNHSQVPPKKTRHIPIIIRQDTNFWHRLLISAPSEIKTHRNRINCMRLTSPKVHLSKTIHDWLRPLRIVPYRAIIYAFFSKRVSITVTWSNFVNNTLIAYTLA